MSDPAYLDSSVVVAYYIPEPSSERVQALYGDIGRAIISELVDLEVAAAVSLRLRIGDLEAAQARQIVTLFDEHREAGLYSMMHLQPDHFRWARAAISRFDLPLKSPDALHLAAAAIGGYRLATADRHLARNADALGVPFELIES